MTTCPNRHCPDAQIVLQSGPSSTAALIGSPRGSAWRRVKCRPDAPDEILCHLMVVMSFNLGGGAGPGWYVAAVNSRIICQRPALLLFCAGAGR